MSENPVRVAMILSDDREDLKKYSEPNPFFGAAPTALLNGLAKTPNCEVHIISCVQRPVAAPAKIAGNIFFHALLVPKWGWLRGAYLGCIMAIRKKLRQLQPDVVHGQGTERYYALAAAFSGFPNVITIHGNMRRLAAMINAPPFSFPWLTAKLEAVALSRTLGVLCNSKHTEELVKPRTPRTWRVPHALGAHYFSPLRAIRREVPVLLNVGTISPLKGQIELLDAMRILHQQNPKFQMQFLGRVDERSDYGAKFLERMKEPAIQAFAQYTGFESPPELVERFDSASALVHVSKEESFGLVVAEALSRNLKLFAFKAGAVEEIAGGVDSAELCEIDDWKALIEKIRRWLDTGCRLPTCASAEMRTRYSPEVVARKHVEIYLSVRPPI